MKSEPLVVTTVTLLANGFSEVKLRAENHAQLAEPGHYVVLQEKYPCYLHGKKDDTIWLIVPKHADLPLNLGHTLTVSPLLGLPLGAPTSGYFQLIQANEEALSAAIFYLKKYKSQFAGLVLLGAKQFPFHPCPSRLLIAGMPPEVIAVLPLFEDWRIPHRLASTIEQPGCFHGTIEQLADIWQNSAQIAMPLQKLSINSL